MKEIDEQPFEL